MHKKGGHGKGCMDRRGWALDVHGEGYMAIVCARDEVDVFLDVNGKGWTGFA